MRPLFPSAPTPGGDPVPSAVTHFLMQAQRIDARSQALAQLAAAKERVAAQLHTTRRLQELIEEVRVAEERLKVQEVPLLWDGLCAPVAVVLPAHRAPWTCARLVTEEEASFRGGFAASAPQSVT